MTSTSVFDDCINNICVDSNKMLGLTLIAYLPLSLSCDIEVSYGISVCLLTRRHSHFTLTSKQSILVNKEIYQ